MNTTPSPIHYETSRFNDRTQRDEWFGGASEGIVLNKYKSIPGNRWLVWNSLRFQRKWLRVIHKRIGRRTKCNEVGITKCRRSVEIEILCNNKPHKMAIFIFLTNKIVVTYCYTTALYYDTIANICGIFLDVLN